MMPNEQESCSQSPQLGNQQVNSKLEAEQLGSGNSLIVSAQSSHESFSGLESDRWSQRGVSSHVNINVGDGDNPLTREENKEGNRKKCRCISKFWGNFILPVIFGVEKHRAVYKSHKKSPLAKQLVTNVVHYNTIISTFIKNEFLLDIKSLATEMYFPTGQIEADGLSVISAEMWAATYLLQCVHGGMREADFHIVRSAYTSLAWDSSRAYRAALQYQQIFYEFRECILPFWQKIEKLVGIENVDSDLPKPSESIPGGLASVFNFSFKSFRRKEQSRMQLATQPLPTVRMCDDLLLQNNLALRIIPEVKSALVTSMSASNPVLMEKEFNDLDYGRQMEIIKELLRKPAEVMHKGFPVLKKLQLSLLNDGSALPGSEMEISCTRAVKTLAATLKLVYKEVKLTQNLQVDLYENLRATADEIHSSLAYSEWVIRKISEFHSMLKICYNFALMSFDLDLPSFEKVIKQETISDYVFKPKSITTSAKMAKSINEEQLEYKVQSLTRLMMEASAAIHTHGEIDENFDYEDFYKTEYHVVLQRLPLRLGFNLLQFSIKPEVKTTSQQHMSIITSTSSVTESVASETDIDNESKRLTSIYRMPQPPLLGSENGPRELRYASISRTFLLTV